MALKASLSSGVYARRADFVEKLLLRAAKREVHTVLDLACGTGTMTALFTERGYELIAVDASEEGRGDACVDEEEAAPFQICLEVPLLVIGECPVQAVREVRIDERQFQKSLVCEIADVDRLGDDVRERGLPDVLKKRLKCAAVAHLVRLQAAGEPSDAQFGVLGKARCVYNI